MGVATDDAATTQSMRLFDKNWRTYSKVVALNYMFHREVYGELRKLLLAQTPRSYSFLDLACGDASATVDASPRHFHRFVSRHRPVAASAVNCSGDSPLSLDCRVTLEHRNFVEASRNLHETGDVIWIGQSLHHLNRAQKLAAMRNARRLCGRARPARDLGNQPGNSIGKIRPRGSGASSQRAVRAWTLLGAGGVGRHGRTH